MSAQGRQIKEDAWGSLTNLEISTLPVQRETLSQKSLIELRECLRAEEMLNKYKALGSISIFRNQREILGKYVRRYCNFT